ncbi:hypothetical protein P5V15_015806 [Pogonomyrmex californicus]
MAEFEEEESAVPSRQPLTLRRSPWPKFTNCTSNWLTTHRIHQIWPPATFSCFLSLKFRLERFSSNEEVIAYVNAYFAEQDANYYLERLKRLEYRWEKCIDLKRDYVEK